MKQELAEEGSRCSILSKQHRFNEHCCIRCCAPFTFLLNPKRQCLDCQYNVCKGCCTYSKRDKAWLCSACQKGRIFRTQSLEWYYNNVKARFRRFGSAKVLKTLYRKHIIERGTLSDLPGNAILCSLIVVETKAGLTVEKSVPLEAKNSEVGKCACFLRSLRFNNRCRYKICSGARSTRGPSTADDVKVVDWLNMNLTELRNHVTSTVVVAVSLVRRKSPVTHVSVSFCSYFCVCLQRSRSAFSLTSDDSLDKGPEEEAAGAGGGALQEYVSLKREAKVASLPGWKSMDRLDNSSASSVLQSPDGNWIALHSSQLSRPSLLTKRKSLVFSVLEQESNVVSAYDEMGSEEEDEVADEGGWGAALQQFRRKLSDETYYTDSQHDPEWTYTQHLPVTSPSSGQYTNTETLNSDSEASSVLSAYPRKPPHNLLKKKGPADAFLHPHQQPLYQQHLQQNLPPYTAHSEALDVNFNPKVTGDSSDAEEKQSFRISRRRRRSKKESSAEQSRPGGPSHAQSIYPLAQDNSGFLLHALLKRGLSDEQPVPDCKLAATTAPLDPTMPETEVFDIVAPHSPAPNPLQHQPMSPRPQLFSRSLGLEFCPGDNMEEEVQSKLIQMVSRGNSKDTSSSDEECMQKNKQTEKASEKQKEKLRPKESERPRRRASDNREMDGEALERVNGQEVKRGARLEKSSSVREEVQEEGSESLEEKVDEPAQKRGDRREMNRVSKRQQKREVGKVAGARRSVSSASFPAVSPSAQEGELSNNQQKYSAASLCSITTEVLKVLNATEELIGEAGGDSFTPSESTSASPISSCSETRRLDQRLTKMEENVYLAAGAVYGLEGALGELEQCARGISSGTTDTELAFLEDQVATAAAQVQQSELQISNIEARISALKTAGLNVTVCNRFKLKPKPKPETIDSSRHQRRKLPAPPLRENLESEQQVRVLRP
ncbi:transcript variant X2 [Nothobranchius furzeri]|uniref:Transcript variant X2 n=1 Tax=Nothobranchius furzeri TaxID=105023 RepID=A0A9D2Y4S4_NOTFU|nr:transcript variant X2 [Nothobranchius furzeri]